MSDTNGSSRSPLDRIRRRIDAYDDDIQEAVAGRLDQAVRVAFFKRELGMEIVDEERRKQVIAGYRAWAERNDLSPEFGERLALLLIEEAEWIERKVVEEGPPAWLFESLD